jgi:hypothetical protein
MSTKAQKKKIKADRPIKAASVQQIEDVFSKALGELTGMYYKVTINRLDLSPEPNLLQSDISRIELTLSSELDETIPF